LVVHDEDIERIQGRRDQGAHRQARAGLRIGELLKGRRGAGSPDYCCSHFFLRGMIVLPFALASASVAAG
jgi:hypothetical protein